jgi:hypothetical protein
MHKRFKANYVKGKVQGHSLYEEKRLVPIYFFPHILGKNPSTHYGGSVFLNTHEKMQEEIF